MPGHLYKTVIYNTPDGKHYQLSIHKFKEPQQTSFQLFDGFSSEAMKHFINNKMFRDYNDYVWTIHEYATEDALIFDISWTRLPSPSPTGFADILTIYKTKLISI